MRTLLTCCILILAFSASAFAQGVRGAEVRSAPTGTTSETMGEGESPIYSRSVTGKILEVDANSGLIVVERSSRGRFRFMVDGDARIRADKDTDLAGRKDISLGDYKPGQTVKISYRVRDWRVLEVRLKKPKS